MSKVTSHSLIEMKGESQKIACLTVYDYSFAAVLDQAGVDVVLVGDSLGNVIQGQDSTLPVTLEEMVYHSRCVARGAERALRVVDMPFMSFQAGVERAVINAGRLVKEGAAEMVKLEGGSVVLDQVKAITDASIPVCAHLGLTPQSVHKFGGYKVQGRDPAAAEKMKNDALALQQAGATLLVLEAIPRSLAGEITEELKIPTIGIGAGPQTDGQVLVLHDMLGVYPGKRPKFCRNFMPDADDIQGAIKAYVDAVKTGSFPTADHSFD
ncbi:MAG: 3-methyl-2-oxobutanoate hydroxymethyltransferase [Acidiferrobacterales bacterium]